MERQDQDNPAIRSMLERYRRELQDFDTRPERFRPRNTITPVGEALLLHREIEAMTRCTADPGDVDAAVAESE